MAGKGMSPAKGRNLPKWREGWDQINWKPKPKRRRVKKAAPKALTTCMGARDGECFHELCPQIRDNEPHATGRHCPLDTLDEYEEC